MLGLTFIWITTRASASCGGRWVVKFGSFVTTGTLCVATTAACGTICVAIQAWFSIAAAIHTGVMTITTLSIIINVLIMSTSTWTFNRVNSVCEVSLSVEFATDFKIWDVF